MDLLGTRFLRLRTARMPRAALIRPILATSLDLIERPLEQVHFVLGGRGPRAGRSRALRAVPPEHRSSGEHVLAPVPGGAGARGTRSISIHSGNAAFRDGGHFYVYAGTEPAHFRRVVELTLREFRSLRDDGVTADELRRAKDHLKGSLMLSLGVDGQPHDSDRQAGALLPAAVHVRRDPRRHRAGDRAGA